MAARVTSLVLCRGLLLFWAAWLTVVVGTNLLDGLRTTGFVPGVRFASGNWAWINQVMDPLEVPRWMQACLYGGAVVWEAVAAGLFWRAARVYRGGPLPDEPAAAAACATNLALWAAFQVLDEVFLAYQPEAVHRAIFVSQLATLVVLQLLPAGNRSAGGGGNPG